MENDIDNRIIFVHFIPCIILFSSTFSFFLSNTWRINELCIYNYIVYVRRMGWMISYSFVIVTKLILSGWLKFMIEIYFWAFEFERNIWREVECGETRPVGALNTGQDERIKDVFNQNNKNHNFLQRISCHIQ